MNNQTSQHHDEAVGVTIIIAKQSLQINIVNFNKRMIQIFVGTIFKIDILHTSTTVIYIFNILFQRTI